MNFFQSNKENHYLRNINDVNSIEENEFLLQKKGNVSTPSLNTIIYTVKVVFSNRTFHYFQSEQEWKKIKKDIKRNRNDYQYWPIKYYQYITNYINMKQLDIIKNYG